MSNLAQFNTIRLVFNVSRFEIETDNDGLPLGMNGKLWLGEYINKEGYLARLGWANLDGHNFIGGVPYAALDGDKAFFFQDRTDGFEKALIKYNVNYRPSVAAAIRAQLFTEEGALTEMGTILSNPPIEDDGTSGLYGFQLVIYVVDRGIEVRTDKNGWQVVDIAPDQVSHVEIIVRGHRDFTTRRRVVDLGLMLEAQFECFGSSEHKPATVQDTRDVLLGINKAGASRRGKHKKGNTQKVQDMLNQAKEVKADPANVPSIAEVNSTTADAAINLIDQILGKTKAADL